MPAVACLVEPPGPVEDRTEMADLNVKVRYVAKPYGKYWRVYDRVMASYPVERPDLGVLPTYADKEECEEVAASLDAAQR